MDAATTGVLRDVAVLVWVAILCGVAAYKVLRLAKPNSLWQWRGRVNARPFISADAVIVGGVSLLLLAGLQMNDALAEKQPEVAAPGLTAIPLLINIVFLLGICLALLFYLRSIRGLHPAELFGLRRMGPLAALGFAALFMIPTLVLVNGTAYGVGEWLRTFWPAVNAQEAVQAFQNSEDLTVRILLIFAAVGVAPLVEETVFRGFIYGVIKRYTDSYFAAICSALLFAIVHFHVVSLIPLALLALVLCLAYELTGTLLVPMAMHALFNTASIVALSLGLDK